MNGNYWVKYRNPDNTVNTPMYDGNYAVLFEMNSELYAGLMYFEEDEDEYSWYNYSPRGLSDGDRNNTGLNEGTKNILFWCSLPDSVVSQAQSTE